MDFINSTGFPAGFLPGSMGDAEMLGIVACKVTYALDQGWLIPVSPEQSWPVFDKPFMFQDVSLGPELDFRKKGVDIIVFGHATPPNNEPTQRMQIAVECGRISYRIEVFGDRVWQKSKQKLVPSDPISFLEMPLTNKRAYGGTEIWEGTELSHSINPDGRGFYISANQAAGKPLPNLEYSDSLIQKWSDQPRPACFFKPKGIYFDTKEAPEDPQELIIDLVEPLFNKTIPELVARLDDLEESIRLVGFAADGNIVFPVPPSNGPEAMVTVGSLHSRFPSTISSIIILAKEQVLIVTYICLFRYLFRPMEKRNVELKWSKDPKVIPLTG